MKYLSKISMNEEVYNIKDEEAREAIDGLGLLATMDVVTENDLDATLKEKVNAASDGNHSHNNKSVLDNITEEKVVEWDNKADGDHNHDGIYIKQTELGDAVNTALQTAKESGDFDGTNGKDGTNGVDGITPHIGEDNYWYIGDTSTGVKAQGEDGNDGATGADGADGKGIASIAKTSTSGLVDTYTITYTDGSATTFTVTNGKDGATGATGADGTSVTVSQVTESTESGGENVVEFSDGKTLTVKNGKDGADGNDGANFDPSVLTLGIHTDGLLYIFYNGQPIGNGIALPSGASGDITGNIDTDNNIAFTGYMPAGTYTLSYVDEEGNLTGTGTLTVEAVKTTYTITWVVDGVSSNTTVEEGVVPTFGGSTDKASDGQYNYTFAGWTPDVVAATADATYTAVYNKTAIEVEPTTYTVTFVADNMTVKVVEYTEGDTTLTGVPSVPEKEGYTGAWESYTLNNTNITVNAIYTAIEPINQIPISTDASGALFVGTNGEAGYKTGYRLKTSTGAEDVLSGYEVTGFIPVNQNQTIYIDKITISAASGNEAICFYDSTRKFISGGYASTFFGGTVSGTVASGTVDVANAKYVRLAAKVIDNNSILTVGMPLT